MPTPFWKCDICKKNYTTKALADECEARGAYEDQDHPPQGFVFIHGYGDFLKNQGRELKPGQDPTFVAVISSKPGDRTCRYPHDLHTGAPCVWWFRGYGNGDDENDEWGEGRRDLGMTIGNGTHCKPWREHSMTAEEMRGENVQRAAARVLEFGKNPTAIVDGELVDIPLFRRPKTEDGKR